MSNPTVILPQSIRQCLFIDILKAKGRIKIYLEDVIVLSSQCSRDLLRNGHGLGEVFVRSVVELLSVICAKPRLCSVKSSLWWIGGPSHDVHFGITRA